MAQSSSLAYSGVFSNLRRVSTDFTEGAGAADRKPLQVAAQLAIQVEFTTIPIYLNALYSIKDLQSKPYQTLRSVVMEEMFHVNQACDILVALGGTPRFTDKFAPTYPGYLPNANPGTTPKLVLARASRQVFGEMFVGIETPAPPMAPPQGDNYDSIAQLYAALSDAVHKFPGNPFGSAGGRQRKDIYLGKFGGDIVEVTNLKTFDDGIHQIVQQGEGSVPPDRPLTPFQRYGSYNYYGARTDGTYGPILGTPYELSHFIKFRQIALDKGPFPETWPIMSNPNLENFTNASAIATAKAFNKNYSVMLRSLELCFTADEPDPYFDIVLNLMHRVLPQLARSLMQTPVFEGGDAAVGPNAAPTWTYEPDAHLAELPGAVEAAISTATGMSGDKAPPARATEPLRLALEGLKDILRARPEWVR